MLDVALLLELSYHVLPVVVVSLTSLLETGNDIECFMAHIDGNSGCDGGRIPLGDIGSYGSTGGGASKLKTSDVFGNALIRGLLGSVESLVEETLSSVVAATAALLGLFLLRGRVLYQLSGEL